MFKSAIALAAVVLVGATAAIPAFADEATVPALKAEAAGLVKDYAAQLKAALAGAMESSGPLGALSVCRDQAPIIAAALSRRSGWSIARTSLKPRNAASAPDDYERKVMEDFDARIANGEKAADLASAEIVEDHGVRIFRFVKAIPTTANCLTCHGGEVKAEVKAKIAELYPDDRATGFKLDDMRGAFTLQKRLDAASR
ncbi:MAG: DUF3365 domain-containing protein [Roseiarcus sp.]|jgi:hypothetical protein